MWVTRDLAEYAVSTSIESYPADVRDLGKLFILDTIGCMVGGINTPLSKSMARALLTAGSARTSSIIGSDMRLSATDAALLNGTAANALDFEETLAGIGHPSGTVLASALAAGELRGISGAQLLDAVLVGYDVGNRVGRAIQPSYERLHKVWFVGTWQTFSAVAAASKCLSLDLTKTLHAYGIAGATAPLANSQKWGFEAAERPVHWVKEPTGWPAWAGTLGALLAEQGFIGNRHILDGEKGFWAMAGSDRVDFELMRHGLGSTFEVKNLSIKPYSCCRWQHPALDCLAELRAQYGLRATDIQQVDVYTFDWVQDFEVYGPVDLVDAEFSLPHSMTMLLHDIPPGPQWFSDENLHSSDLTSYSRRVRIHLDEHCNTKFHRDGNLSARVELRLADGKSLSRAVDTALGCPDKPVARTAVEDKFCRLVSPVLGDAAATEALGRIMALEECTDISTILRRLTPR